MAGQWIFDRAAAAARESSARPAGPLPLQPDDQRLDPNGELVGLSVRRRERSVSPCKLLSRQRWSSLWPVLRETLNSRQTADIGSPSSKQ